MKITKATIVIPNSHVHMGEVDLFNQFMIVIKLMQPSGTDKKIVRLINMLLLYNPLFA